MKWFLKLWPLMLTLAMCGAPSHAQTGTCGPGKNCVVNSIRTTGISKANQVCLAHGVYPLGLGTFGAATRLGFYSGTDCNTLASGGIDFEPHRGRQFNFLRQLSQAGGTAGTPDYSFQADPDTGIFSSAANTLDLATGGASRVVVTTTGWRAYLGSSVAFASNAASLQADEQGRAWWQATTSRANTPPTDLGGFQHFALQSRTFAVDMGTEGTTAEWWPRAPRVGGAASTLTFTDAAAAGTATIGATPYARDYRRSNTTSTINTVSSFIATPYLDVSRGMRWCQRVRVVTTSSVRVWAGVGQVLPVGDTPTTHYAAFRYSTAAGDTDWRCCSSAGTATCSASTVAPDPVNGNLLCIDCREGAACTYWVDGVAVRRKATDIPTNRVGPLYRVETLTAAARSLDASHISTETN